MNVIYFHNIADYTMLVIKHVQQHGNHLKSFAVDGWQDNSNYYYLCCYATNTIFTPGTWKDSPNYELDDYIHKAYGFIMDHDTVEKFRNIVDDKRLIKMARLWAFI